MIRFSSILLVIILIIAQVPNLGLADESLSIPISDSDITVSNINIDKSNIKTGEDFKLTITLKNNTKYTATNLMVSIGESSSFEVKGAESKIKVDSRNKVEFNLKYNGGHSIKLPITIYYTLIKEEGDMDPSSGTIENYINISQTVPEGEPDSSEDIPNISIVGSKTTLGKSGDTITIPIDIENTSKNSAYNISTTIELGEGSPLYIDGPKHTNTSRLDSSRSKALSFKVKTDKRTADKTYPIKVIFKFHNQYDRSFTISDTIYVKITDKKIPVQVVINKVDIKPNTDIEPGEDVMVGFEIENIGDFPATDVKVILRRLSSNGFSLASGSNSQSIPILERGKIRYVFFQLKSSRRLTSGNHDLEISLSYKDMEDQEILDESKFFIPVASNINQSANLIMQNISYPTGSIGINRDVNVNFTLRNQGQTEAQNIIITAESADQSGLVPKTVSTIKLNSLSPNTNEKINFTFSTTKNAETKNYPINITVEYKNDLSSTEKKSSINQLVGIFVLGPDDPEDAIKSTPRLIIDKYDFEPKFVKAGENFQMNLSFFNTNSAITIKNIKMFLTVENNLGEDPNSSSSGNSVFTPVDSSNTFYIDSIPPKGRVEKTITMFTIPDAVPKTHMITANFEYEDVQGEEHFATELIGVPVIQQSRLEFGELNYMKDIFIGDLNPISLEFYNTGKVTLYNMMVRLEGDFQTENGSYYVGNFENGSSDYFEGMVIPSEPGELEGAVVFTYEDSTGEEQEIRKEFTLNVMDIPPMDEFSDDSPPMDDNSGGIKGFSKSKGLWATIILLAGGFGGFKFYKKKI